ncbi:phosphonopyruvate decarboxylase [Arsukibacterium sp.]|uniref:phosphonopyruvate decarboxylase n=1 Tax=Arsukibacterium sp. TaxID=1977258 RepID=UPI001BD36387
MIQPADFSKALTDHGVTMYAGVPDSLLESFCAYISATLPADQHIITANEGNALALAAGYHLGTGRTAAVYLQNSGLGNIVNPLTSLTDGEVYRIPALLIIGWRGEPDVKDEPQHVKQGRITTGMLDNLNIPWQVLQADSDINTVLMQSFADLERTSAPVALLVRKNTFADYKLAKPAAKPDSLSREDALATILECSDSSDVIVSTTGKTSRELYELREARNESQRDFLTVGAMGHTSSIALGVALSTPSRRVICLDGDGSFLMHMGGAAIIAASGAENLIHVVLNNQAHESVGGQPTVAGRIDFAGLSKALGYRGYFVADNTASLQRIWSQVQGQSGPVLLEVKIRTGSRADLGRPASTPVANKQAFMEHCGG